jgi:TPR repeat protein
MDWFQKASIKGHPHAAYNLGLGHVQKLHSLLKKGFATKSPFSLLQVILYFSKLAILFLKPFFIGKLKNSSHQQRTRA